MDISVNKQLNRIAEKKTGTNPKLEDMSEIVNYMTEFQSGVNPEKKTIGEALKEYADTMVIGGDVNTDDATAVNSDLMQGKTAYARGNRLVGTYVPLDTSDATASTDDIMDGYTAYVNGVKVTGTHHDLDTSDATATVNDIMEGKTAYVNGNKITGEYEPLDTSDATAIADDILTGKTAYVNGVKITGTHDVGADGNFSSTVTRGDIQYSAVTPHLITKLPDELVLDMPAPKSTTYLFANCSKITEAPRIDMTDVSHTVCMFRSCSSLVTAPFYDLSDVIEAQGMFRECTALENIPLYDTSNFTTGAAFSYMFYGCPNLTEESLDNILQMCAMATKYIGNKTLYEAGINYNASDYDEDMIRSLPHYSQFVSAGWRIKPG